MTRLDVAIQANPAHEDAIRLLASRDPAKNLKYLHWQIKILLAGQALAPEIADVVDMFHRHNGGVVPRRRVRIMRDIYSYGPANFAGLRDDLLKEAGGEGR